VSVSSLAAPWVIVSMNGVPVHHVTGNEFAIGATLPSELFPESAASGPALAEMEQQTRRARELLWLYYLFVIISIPLTTRALLAPRASRLRWMNAAALAHLGVALAVPLFVVLHKDAWVDLFRMHGHLLEQQVRQGHISVSAAQAAFEGASIRVPGWDWLASAGGAFASIAMLGGIRALRREERATKT